MCGQAVPVPLNTKHRSGKEEIISDSVLHHKQTVFGRVGHLTFHSVAITGCDECHPMAMSRTSYWSPVQQSTMKKLTMISPPRVLCRI